jgi:hypothetical protein
MPSRILKLVHRTFPRGVRRVGRARLVGVNVLIEMGYQFAVHALIPFAP